jgi:hypothetical protein
VVEESDRRLVGVDDVLPVGRGRDLTEHARFGHLIMIASNRGRVTQNSSGYPCAHRFVGLQLLPLGMSLDSHRIIESSPKE